MDIESGTVSADIGEENDEDADTIQTFTSNGELVVTSHKSGLLKLWNTEGTLLKMWKYIHKGPVAKLTLFGDELYSGGSDGTVRAWNLKHQTCTLSLRDCPGVVSVVERCPSSGQNLLFASGDDYHINAWDLHKSGKLVMKYEGHFSKVTAISFHSDGEHFVSSGRDKVLILWRIGQPVALKTVPLYEALETVVCLPGKFKLPGGELVKAEGAIYVASAGENGKLRVWDVAKPKQLYEQQNSLISKANEEGGLAVLKLLFSANKKRFALVSAEHNIIIHEFKSMVVYKQFVGFSDEILDIALLGENDEFVAVATNSCDIKLYADKTMNCQLLRGHTDLVLALNKSASNPNLLVSGSKDNSVRLWSLRDGTARCVAVGRRHTGSVTSVAFGQTSSEFFVSASQDTCLKLWTLPEQKVLEGNEESNLSCSNTQIAHQKDINCVSVAPNDKIIATASQDKTAKLWSRDLEEIGTLRGHRRGVWCVRFSPVDQIVITSSADCSVKLWSIADLSCLKTIEGHEASVTRIEFLSKGMQILTAGADGLIKLFNVKSSECTSTFEEHAARIWTVALKRDETGFVSGGTDSLLITWRDVSEEIKEQRLKELEERTLEEQRLQNYVQNEELLKALKLALKLDRPFQVLRIVQGVMKKGDMRVASTISELSNGQKEALLKCATTWNTNSKHCQAAQLIINILLNELQKGQFRPAGLGGVLEGTLPYTERHFNRLTQLMQDVNFINYTISCMQLQAKVE